MGVNDHGQASTYVNYGCRCEACTQANSEYLRRSRRPARCVQGPARPQRSVERLRRVAMATEFIYDTPLWKVRRLGDGWYQGETPLWKSPTRRTRDFVEARRWIETQVERYLDAAKAATDRSLPNQTETVAITCPDGGRCWHECRRHCWRVHNAGPLSDYGADEWPDHIDDTPHRPTTIGTGLHCRTRIERKTVFEPRPVKPDPARDVLASIFETGFEHADEGRPYDYADEVLRRM